MTDAMHSNANISLYQGKESNTTIFQDLVVTYEWKDVVITLTRGGVLDSSYSWPCSGQDSSRKFLGL